MRVPSLPISTSTSGSERTPWGKDGLVALTVAMKEYAHLSRISKHLLKCAEDKIKACYSRNQKYRNQSEKTPLLKIDQVPGFRQNGIELSASGLIHIHLLGLALHGLQKKVGADPRRQCRSGFLSLGTGDFLFAEQTP